MLGDLAAEHGLERPTAAARLAYLADYEEGRARAVQGPPHFFVADRDYFCPSLHIDREGGAVSITPDPGRLDALLDDCFSTVD